MSKLGQYKVKFDLAAVNTNVVNDIVLVPIVPEHQWKSVKGPGRLHQRQAGRQRPFTEVDNFSRPALHPVPQPALLGQRQPLHRLPAHAADGHQRPGAGRRDEG